MKIFVVQSADGYFEDKTSNIELVTENEEKAYERLLSLKHEGNSIEIWENGDLVSYYIRDYSEVYGFSKWERNYGEVNKRLEDDNVKLKDLPYIS